MAKKFHAPTLEDTAPQGPITVSAAPIAVQVCVRWIIGAPTEWTVIHNCWAMAWTKEQVLVVWLSGDKVSSHWLWADQVRRQPPPS